MGPGTLGLAATQINVFVNTVLATGEGTGAVSWLNYAFRLMYLPLGIFGVSIATAAMPAIARHAAREDIPGMRHEVASGIAMMAVLNVPATLGLIVLARPIVAMLFERGAFTPHDTGATAAALMCYAIGLTGYSVVKVVSPTFYALHESRKPVMVSAASVLVNAGAQYRVRQAFRLPGPGGRHVADGAPERVGAAGDAPPSARRHRGRPPARRLRPQPGGVARHGGHGVRDRLVDDASPARAFASRPGGPRRLDASRAHWS